MLRDDLIEIRTITANCYNVYIVNIRQIYMVLLSWLRMHLSMTENSDFPLIHKIMQDNPSFIT